MPNYFSLSMFFVVLRETLEVAIITSVLLAFISRLNLQSSTLPSKLRMLVYAGTFSAVAIVATAGGILLNFWYKNGVNLFAGSEQIYEATFGIIAAVFLTITAFAFLKGQNLYKKITLKLERHFQIDHIKQQLITEDSAKDNENPEINIQSTNSQIERNTVELSTVSNIAILKQNSSTPGKLGNWAGIQVFFWVPFLTVIREGIETILIIGGKKFF